MNPYLSKLKEFEEMRNKLISDLKGQFDIYFDEAVKEIFALPLNVKGIFWTQYTPYFNDGDECIFGLGEIFYITDESVLRDIANGENYWHYEEEVMISSWELEQTAGTGIAAIFKDFETMLESSEDILKIKFGDHVRVLVTIEGDDIITNVEEYSHD